MSLINQMLRDLDARQNRDADEIVRTRTVRIPPKRKRVAIYLWIPLLALILGGGTAWWSINRAAPSRHHVASRIQGNSASSKPQPEQAKQKPVPSASMSHAGALPDRKAPGLNQGHNALPPVRPHLVSVKTATRKHGTRVTLTFSRPLKDPPQLKDVHSLTVTLDGTGSATSIPNLPLPIQGLARLTVSPDSTGLKLHAIAADNYQLNLTEDQTSGTVLLLTASSSAKKHTPAKAKAARPRRVVLAKALAVAAPENFGSPEQNAADTRHKKQTVVQDTSNDVSEQAHVDYNLAVRHLKAGDTSRGMQELKTALAMEPDLTPARLLLSALLWKHSQPNHALNILDTGIKTASDTNLDNLKRLKARILLSEGQPRQAIELLSKGAPPDRKEPGYHALLAAIESRAGEYRKAATEYRALVSLDPHRPRWWLGLAIALDQTNQNRAAKQAYLAALKLGGLPAASTRYADERLRALQSAAPVHTGGI